MSQNPNQTTPPQYRLAAFTCPLCNAYAKINWRELRYINSYRPFTLSVCQHCNEEILWHTTSHGEEASGHIIFPCVSTAPLSHPDLPESCKTEYEEARAIVDQSPRGAAALLRLCLEKLCASLTQKEQQGINDNIRDLVAQGLPALVQQSLDYLRVIGNNAVHPGMIDLRDTPEMVHSMFGLINFIVENQITQPRAIEFLYSRIPEGTRQAIARRDSPSKK